MKYYFLSLFFFLVYFKAHPQAKTKIKQDKPSLDYTTINAWPVVGGGTISNNGNYVYYYSFNNPIGTRTLIVKSVVGNWIKEIKNGLMPIFTNDCENILFNTGSDTLYILRLGEEEMRFVPDVKDYKLGGNEHSSWIAYRDRLHENELCLFNLHTGKDQRFSAVVFYQFCPKGEWLLLGIKEIDKGTTNLTLLDLNNGNSRMLPMSFATGSNPKQFAFDNNSEKLAVLVEKIEGERALYVLWLYDLIRNTATLMIDKENNHEFILCQGNLEFNSDGTQLYFQIKPISNTSQPSSEGGVEVWSYLDAKLKSLQLSDDPAVLAFTAVLDIPKMKVFRIDYDDERVISKKRDYVLVVHQLGNKGIYESDWNQAAMFCYYQVSTKDGSRKLIKKNVNSRYGTLGTSPEGKWILYYDFDRKNYFSYEIATDITRNISKDLPVCLPDENNDNPSIRLAWTPGRKTWLKDDEAVIIYDSYDVWLVDPAGKKLPVNITNGYGRKHKIKFELVNEGTTISQISLQAKSVLLLRAFNKLTKDAGFFQKNLNELGDPELLYMGPNVFGEWEGQDSYNSLPLKAKNANIYLVMRMGTKEAPNYFWTHDFRSFTTLSNIKPQDEYNWVTAELIKWKMPDGSLSTGILYKPENFNPNRKYPLIFDIYEKRSDELNLFISPKLAEGRINIAYYISNGYLIFTPDIHYKTGYPGESAYNTVVSAANHLMKFPWVDGKRLGIQGHSFGGYETLFIITHSNIFKAACAASGISDLVSVYGSGYRGSYFSYSAEKDQLRIGATLWAKPDLYIRNSPIFNADKVTTPLLMMHNKQDGVVPFSQSVEFFTALRRLKRKVWLLQYDSEDHVLDSKKTALDFSIRMVQFFDHYLKDRPASNWMANEIRGKSEYVNKEFE